VSSAKSESPIDPSTAERIARAQKAAERFADQADVTLAIGADGLLLYASPSWGDILGRPSGAGVGRPLPLSLLTKRIGEAGRRSLLGHLEALRAGRARTPIFFACDQPGPDTRFYEGRAYDSQDAAGLLVLLHDVSDRWQRTVALAEDEQRFATVADICQDIVSETDSETGEFTYVSGASQAVLGYSPEELVGTPALALHHPEDVEGFVHTLQALGVPNRSFRVPPHRLRRRDGSWVWMEATGIRYVRPDGRPCTIGVARDITARIEGEQTRAALEARLQRSQKLESLGVLAGGIAHDFNNLLTPVVGAVDLLTADLPPDSPLRRHVETIRAAADHARVLTDQMLAFAGESALEYQTVDLDEVVARMTRLLETMIARNATLVLRPGADVPPICADAGQIGQVVVNLVTNACEALPPSGGRVEIRTGAIEADRELLDRCHLGESLEVGRYALLEVEDDGPGIEAQALDRILDPFFSTKFTGRGLGLAVVLGIVRRHDGCLRIESRVGTGTLFQVLLPVASEAPASLAREPVTAPKPAPLCQGELLVVDDDAGARELTLILLQRAGFEVREAPSGKHALELFARHRDTIAGVILDGTMPEMSGAKVFDAMRAIDPDVRVLLISGYTRERDANALFERGLVGFLHKPFDADQLLAEVRRMLASGEGESRS
jgi:PAS domain S-box-containing protein